MFLEGPTIGFDGFSMVFEILRAMVNDGLEVNNGLHVPLHKKVRKINSRQNANFKQSTQMNISEHLQSGPIQTLHTVQQRKGNISIDIGLKMSNICCTIWGNSGRINDWGGEKTIQGLVWFAIAFVAMIVIKDN